MFQRFIALAVVLGGGLVAGCANDGSLVGGDPIQTSAVTPAPKVDPVCVTLAAQIETLRKDGIAEKVEKAAAKKYKMKPDDLVKADQLNKTNAEFQNRCSKLAPRPTTAQAPGSSTVATAAPAAANAPAQALAPKQ
jgi:outer membrane murein-binding lipoprotein Lpp